MNCRPVGDAAECTYCGDAVLNNSTHPTKPDGETCDPAANPDPTNGRCRPGSTTRPGKDQECTYCGDGTVQDPAPAPIPNEKCDPPNLTCDPASPPPACPCNAPCQPCDTITVGDYVWDDKNRDGLQGATETGINGVVLEIRDCAGTLVTTLTTTTGGPSMTAGWYEYTTTTCEASSGVRVVVADSNFTGTGALVGYQETIPLVGGGGATNNSKCQNRVMANTCTTQVPQGGSNLAEDCGLVSPECGDGFVDAALGETFDPAAPQTPSAACRIRRTEGPRRRFRGGLAPWMLGLVPASILA